MGMREDYLAAMKNQLNEWKAQAERFKTSAEQMEAHGKIQYDNNLAYLHATKEEAWANFAKVEGAGEPAWEQFKANMDKAGKELNDAAERMTTQAKK
jgi:hypothetical protein